MTRLILVRHAPTAETGKRLTGRLPGVPLTPAGGAAATALARHLAGTSVQALYTSPALRCRQTAALVAAPHSLRPKVHYGLAEVDYGTWAGRSLASLRRTAAWRLVRTAPSQVRFPDGEAVPAVQARGVAACEALAASNPEATLLLVSHGDVISMILAYYLGMPLDLYPRLAVAPASASTVDLSPSGPPRVSGVNLVPESG